MKIKVLIEGYAKEVNGEEFASCSTTLIDDGENKILIDPGMNRQLLIERLKKENLNIGDINIILLTHTHLDHSLLVGMFGNAEVYDNESIYSMNSKIKEHNNSIGKNIEIISTPGHDQFHMSILIKNTNKNNIIVAGDVFWWWDNEVQKIDKKSLLSKIDPYVKDQKALLNSRKKLLEIADYIIPGHGKPFSIKGEK